MLRRIHDTIEQVWKFCQERKDAWHVPRDAARFLYAAAIAAKAKRIVEIGTSYGFSGLHLAAAAMHNGGTLATIDPDGRKVAISRDHFALAGLGKVIEQHCGAAQEILPIITGPIDFVFVDAIKSESMAYFKLFIDKLAANGVIITDNLATHPEAEFGEFLPAIRNDRRLVSVTLPIGNGFEFTVKLK